MQVHSATAIGCGACGTANHEPAKFCKSCGHGLFEPCVGCATSVLLTQRFCASCGQDLEQALQKRHEQHEQWLSAAVAAAKQSDFERALDLLNRVAELDDYRFTDAIKRSQLAIHKIRTLKTRAEESAEQILIKAKRADQQGDRAELIRLLESLPEKLRTDPAKEMLRAAQSFQKQVTALEQEIQSAVALKNWVSVGNTVDQLLGLAPEHPTYQRLSDQVTVKLTAEAKRLYGSGRYQSAVEKLAAVPTRCRDEPYEQLQQTIRNVEWLSMQFDDEPFASPMLGRLAVRFANEVPSNADAQSLIKKISARLKTAPESPRQNLPAWQGQNRSWLGGKVGLLGQPTSVEVAEGVTIKSAASNYPVAIGLALQGLDRARINEQFAPKKNNLLALGRRKPTLCWGVDVGAAGIKAVGLQVTDDKIMVIDSFVADYETPLCRPSNETPAISLIQPVIQRFLDEKEIGAAPLWCNLPASQLIHRFVCLPPVPDKQALKLVEQEIEQKIPIPANELSIVQSISPLVKDSMRGRPSVISAAKQSVVQARLELLAQAGLKVSGLQADPIALVNFAAVEFAELWDSDDQTDHEATDQKSPVVAIVDCGAGSTTLAMVSADSHWFWTAETGGEDLTMLLARGAKTTRSDAEQIKRNPAALTSPAAHYGGVELRQDELRCRLEKAYADAVRQNPDWRVVQTWCSGGGSLAHGWVRRVLLESSTSTIQ